MALEGLLLELFESHIALLVVSRGARWERRSELLLEEEQLRADEELKLAEGTSLLTSLAPSARHATGSSRALALRCTREPPGNATAALASLVEGHRHAGVLSQRLAAAAHDEGRLDVVTAAARLAADHDHSARTLARIERRARARQGTAAEKWPRPPREPDAPLSRAL